MFAVLDLNKRKRKILDAVVRDYLHTAEPVGSLTIWENYLHAFSPATIRNELMDLEETGYLSQPYSSAGRIPTDRGYRFYVDHLMRKRELTSHEEEELKKSFNPIHLEFEIEEVLHQTVRILSHTLDYAAIVINLGQNYRIFSAGIGNILRQPEFQKIDQARRLVEFLEAEDSLTEIAKEYYQIEEVTLKIGSENKYQETKDCSVLIASYELSKEKGVIEVIGPTRMFYNKVLRVLKFVAKELKEIGEKL